MGLLGGAACGGNSGSPFPDGSTTGADKVVPCPCTAQGTVTGTIDGRSFTMATGLIQPSVGDLEIRLFETGSAPVCYESGKVSIADGGGTRVIVGVCLPATGDLTITGLGGPVGTHCTERSGNAGVVIADPGDTGLIMNGGSVKITSADGACVSGEIAATYFRVMGSAQITETLRGTFTVPNASCYSGWTSAVTKYCPP